MMKRKKLIIVAIFMMSIAMVMPAKQVMAKKVLLKTQAMFPLSMPLLGKPLVWFSDQMKTISSGEIIFKLYDPGKLVPVTEILESVSKGHIQAGYAAPGFWMGKVPAAPIFGSVPFGPEGPEYMAWMFQGNGLKLWQEAYDSAGYNVKVFPVILCPPETSGWYAKEIKNPSDFKGLKMRFYGLGGSVIEKLGASATMLPPAEIFPSLEKGAIDAAEFSSPYVDVSQGFYKVVKYNYFPGWHQQTSIHELIINKDLWNKMTPVQQAQIEMGIRASLLQTQAIGEGSQGPVIMKNAEKRGVNNMYWSDEMLAAFKAAWEEVVKEQCSKNEMFNKVWQDLSAFRAQYKVYSELGFLPRSKPSGK
jgi:TRAP-type mannitol/chloroaromatic compound transport system substrate-binding protein